MRYKLRKQYRLPHHNYSSDGYYFVTICTKNRINFFGKIQNGRIILNTLGMITKKFWLQIPNHFQNVRLGEFVIMPNHMHGIIIIHDPVGTGQCPVPTGSKFGHVTPKSISTIIGSFKSITTRKIIVKYPNEKFSWQTRFYDHIIRNGKSLNNIRSYIINNPIKWEFNRNKPTGIDKTWISW